MARFAVVAGERGDRRQPNLGTERLKYAPRHTHEVRALQSPTGLLWARYHARHRDGRAVAKPETPQRFGQPLNCARTGHSRQTTRHSSEVTVLAGLWLRWFGNVFVGKPPRRRLTSAFVARARRDELK
jgi:hypothetical protein